MFRERKRIVFYVIGFFIGNLAVAAALWLPRPWHFLSYLALMVGGVVLSAILTKEKREAL